MDCGSLYLQLITHSGMGWCGGSEGGEEGKGGKEDGGREGRGKGESIEGEAEEGTRKDDYSIFTFTFFCSFFLHYFYSQLSQKM